MKSQKFQLQRFKRNAICCHRIVPQEALEQNYSFIAFTLNGVLVLVLHGEVLFI